MAPAINTNADSGSHFVPQHFDSSSARTRVPHHTQNSPYYPCYPSPPSWYCLELCLKLILAAQKSYPSDVGDVRALIKCDFRILSAMFAGVIFCNYHRHQDVLNGAQEKMYPYFSELFLLSVIFLFLSGWRSLQFNLYTFKRAFFDQH